MFKFRSYLLAFCCVFLLAGCNGKMAVINSGKVFQESQSGMTAINHLKTVNEELQAQLMQEEAQATKQKNKKADMTRLQQRFMEAQQIATAEQQRVILEYNKKYQAVLDTYRNQKKISVVLDSESALSYDAKADITNDLIKEMDKTPFVIPAAE